MVPRSSGTFSPNPAQSLQTGISHSPHPSQAGALSAAASPSTSSPTGTSSLSKITIAQVYLLLSTIKEKKDDPADWENKVTRLNKLIDDNGMEVFTKYFARLVHSNAAQIFPGLNRPGGNTANPGNYPILVSEMRKISHDIDQAEKIAESIATGTEDIFRDFDLSTFMEHFKLDALEKTILAVAFKLGNRPDLKTKADAILSTNFPTFISIASRPDGEHSDLSPQFLSLIIDRLIQYHPPNFNAASKRELSSKVDSRYTSMDQAPPSEVLAALDLMRVLGEKPPNALVLFIQRTGAEFTRDEETCTGYLQQRPANIQLSEEQVSNALTYTTISQSPRHNPAVLVAGLRRVVPSSFRWQDVVSYFDQSNARISSPQFLRLYNALLPIAQADNGATFDIQHLWGGNWENPEAQLSFICAFASLSPDQLDASAIPGLQPTFTLEAYAQSPAPVRERAAIAVKHPLVSVAALSAVFHVALHSVHASQTVEAKRLFQEVVVPNLDIFVVSAFGVPKPWPQMAVETLNSLFENFLYKRSPEYDFVLDSLWRKDKDWVKQRLVDAHAMKPIDLPLIFEHAVKHNWLDELVYMVNGFGLDLTAFAHAEGFLDLDQWARNNADRSTEIARSLLQFLLVKANLEMQFQRPPDGQPIKTTTTLQVKTVSHLLAILEEYLPKTPVPELIVVQRSCITVYPRLINYGEGYDDIIDANGKDGNALPLAANNKMEEHYKKMYGDEVQVRHIVEVLERYKHSRDPLEQDIFACMIHGLFDEYTHYIDYPLEALATTAVLFGGIISHKLVSDLPLQIGLGMILESVRDHMPDDSMYKFGLQALMQLFGRLHEWPGFCEQLLQIPGLQGTEAWRKAEEVVRDHEEEMARTRNGNAGPGHGALGGESLTNGNADDSLGPDHHLPPFTAINVDPPPPGVIFEDPTGDAQGKIQFVLNNITETTLQSMFMELREMLNQRHQQWFASHLVEERAKMQPNYHHVYLELVKQFEDKSLWTEILRETFVSVSRMLNSEATMQNSTERTHLKNLGGWLGLLTLARDKPIKHKNIAFKQLLIEAHDTKRLIVVIPFVCKVLMQGASSKVFRPPNPWLMDIIHLLIELYHNAELKLNLKFEIEVLCKGLNLDHKSIEPSGEILNRVAVEEVQEAAVTDTLDTFENLSLNGIGPGVAGGLSPHSIAPSIPDLGPSLVIPPTNEMVVTSPRLHEIVRSALTRALQDIIQPVVDRSVTIAAISTQQMIHKDFATEPDENRVRTSAINMVKATAGSLALVTSKEPLRANFTNYMRNLSNDLPQGLPEGTIIMCVNSNLDLASSVIEKSAEERAVPEIEEMIEPELEARRRHRLQRPNEPYVDSSLSRWAWTIPNPFKLSPSLSGLNPEQMAIYEDFARQPRANVTAATPSHVPSTSDATRSLANEVLQDQYSSVPNIPTPAETPSLPHMGAQLQQYSHVHAAAVTNGRQPGVAQVDLPALAQRLQKLLFELQRAATEAREEHFSDLPRPHQVIDTVDSLVQMIIKTQSSEEFVNYAAEQICTFLFSPVEDSLAIESFVQVLDYVRKIGGPSISNHVRAIFHQQDGQRLLRLPLIAALLGTDLLDWRQIDDALAKTLRQKDDKGLQLLDDIVSMTALNDSPIALLADFIQSLNEAYAWIHDDPDIPGAQRLKSRMEAAMARGASLPQEEMQLSQREQMDYVFDEWIHLCRNSNVAEKFASSFIKQLHATNVVASKEDLFLFIRLALDKAVNYFEHLLSAGHSISDAYVAVDGLAKLIVAFFRVQPEEEASDGQSARVSFLNSVWALAVMILNHHHVKRGEHFNQRVFYRFFSALLHEVSALSEQLSDLDKSQIVLKFAARLNDLGPSVFPGFTYAWMSLLEHRAFLPQILKLEGEAGWAPYTKLLTQLLEYLGDQLKAFEVSNLAKDIYRATVKLLLILQHDYPDYLTANHVQIVESIPPYCTQLLNTVLIAEPASNSKLPDPFAQGLRVDKMDEIHDAPKSSLDPAVVLHRLGLLEILRQALEVGPSEDAIAHLTHAINMMDGKQTAFGHIPITANREVIDAITTYIGAHAAQREQQSNGASVFLPGGSDIKTLSMLVHELPPEARYYLLSSMVNQLRFANAYTYFFSQALLDIFGHDLTDPEETEIRQQITRILLERLVGFWPQPWGLIATIVELIKNDKYLFFDLPFIKSAPEVAQRFMEVLQRA